MLLCCNAAAILLVPDSPITRNIQILWWISRIVVDCSRRSHESSQRPRRIWAKIKDWKALHITIHPCENVWSCFLEVHAGEIPLTQTRHKTNTLIPNPWPQLPSFGMTWVVFSHGKPQEETRPAASGPSISVVSWSGAFKKKNGLKICVLIDQWLSLSTPVTELTH